MKLTLRSKLALATAVLGLLSGAFWAFLASYSQPEPASYSLAKPQLEQEKRIEPSPTSSFGEVGRGDPFQSLLPEPAPQQPEPAAADHFVFSPPAPAAKLQRESRQNAPGFSWKLVGIGAGEERLALLKKGSEVLLLQENEQVDGWLLAQIQPQAVVLTRGKEKLSLTLEEVLGNETNN